MFGNLEFMDYSRATRAAPNGNGNGNKNGGVDVSLKSLRRSASLRKRPNPGSISSSQEGHVPARKKRKYFSGQLASIMSGELQIVFIYDTLSVQKEEDDPKDAILYFHPDCIPEERRIAICGQLMGITHFLVDTFSAPKILTLDNGKFAMRKYGRQYILALGCSSVTPDWLLEKQADILYNLTIFFHRDIKSILKTVNGDRSVLSSKLSLIMDHYIPISQHHGDLFALTFGILPILNLPKSASNISLRATIVLQSCLIQNGVLGGIVMYQNKVIGVELAQELAQKLAFIQPYQLPPAEPVRLPFACPPGVQIFAVYVSEEELEKLRKHCATFQHPSYCEPKILKTKENNNKGKIDPIREEEDPSDVSSSLGFSEPSSTKDSSEGAADLNISLTESSSADTGKGVSFSSEKPTTSAVDPPITISLDSKLKFEEFLKTQKGKPPLEVNHNHISASQNKADAPVEKQGGGRMNSLVALPPPCVHLNGCGQSFLKSGRVFKSLENIRDAEEDSAEKSTPPPPPSRCFCASLTDPFFPFIRCDGKSISKALLDVYAGTDESQHGSDEDKENETEMESVPPNDNDDKEILTEKPSTETSQKLPNGSLSETQDDINVANNSIKNNFSIAKDSKQLPPPIPINNAMDSGPSIAAPRRPMDLPLNNKKYNRKKSKRRWSTFEDMMSPVVDTPSRVTESFPAVLPNINENWKNSTSELAPLAPTTNPSHQELFSSFRKLASQDELHNCSDTTSSTDNTIKFNGSIPGNYQNPSMTGIIHLPSADDRTTTHFPSIPFQTKLSTAAMGGNKEENKSQTHLPNQNSSQSNKWNNSAGEGKNGSGMITKNHAKSSLLIYSLGSMRLLLLLEDERTQDPDLIQRLWEYGSSSLSELETSISNVEEQTMSTTASQHDHYCYLHYEAVWRSLAHGGRNHSMDFDVVQQMHQDFNVYPNISELIIRGEDHVVFGYQCVGTEVFYQQSAGLQPGLPMPSDLMGKVPFKAKRRLERDHNILLL